MADYRYTGNYPTEVAVGDKRVPVAPGDLVSDPDLENVDNKILMDSGTLVSVKDLVSIGTPNNTPDKGTASSSATDTTAVTPNDAKEGDK